MSAYLIIKWMHVISSVLLVGTGFGSAFFMFFGNRSGSVAAQAVISRLVVRADWWFTTPAGIFQPLSGFWLAQQAGWPMSTPWLALAIAFYVLAGICWLPVVFLQLRMARMAASAARDGSKMPSAYRQYQRRWEAFGYPAFAAMLVIFYLMLTKPALWST